MSTDTRIDNLTVTNLIMTAGSSRTVPMGTGTCSSNAVTINTPVGKITTESLSTAAGAVQAITLTNSSVAAADVVIATVIGGSSSTGIAGISKSVAGSGSCVITLTNTALVAALNGTVIIGYEVIKA